MQDLVYGICDAVFAFLFAKIDLAARGKIRIDEPRVNADQVGKLSRDIVVGCKMVGFASRRPSCTQGRNDDLLEILKNCRNTCREIVIEKHGAGVEAFYDQSITLCAGSVPA